MQITLTIDNFGIIKMGSYCILSAIQCNRVYLFMDRKIDFIITGVQRAGTSALYFYLRRHPLIGLSQRKELHFFDNERIFDATPVNYDLYHSQFNFLSNKILLAVACM